MVSKYNFITVEGNMNIERIRYIQNFADADDMMRTQAGINYLEKGKLP